MNGFSLVVERQRELGSSVEAMRFFVVFAALALLALCAALGSKHNGSSLCRCIEEHWPCPAGRLESHASCPHDFGIGCETHNISVDCAVSLYQSLAAAQLNCSPSHAGESPWCNTSWCYVNESTCGVDWDFGVLGAYSYATCGNLRQGSNKYFQKSMAAFLQGDSLRVFHPENTLEGGYLGNTGCHKQEKYSQNRYCEGRIADFWERSLDELNASQVQVDHTVIQKNEKAIDQYFMDPNIGSQFEEYKERVQDHWSSSRPTTKFDLCAFATGMGYVDLCSAAFALTHRRQAMTFMIELYTSPVFMVSKIECEFFTEEEHRSLKFWFWWAYVFSPGAWGFFLGTVFFFIVAMKCLDHWLDERSGPAPAMAAGQGSQDSQGCMNKFCKCFCCLTDALLGVFEALAFQSKTSHRRDGNKPRRPRPSHILRLGLGFFIWLSMAVYGSKIIADMVSSKEVKGEVPRLKIATQGPNRVSLCTHSVFQESLELYLKELKGEAYISPIYYRDDWEEVLAELKNETCRAALLDDEAWNTFRSRRELCDFYKEPTAEFYIPTGVVVSKRAYRTLETFRFAPDETPVFWSKGFEHDCPSNSTMCDSTKDGVPWYTLPSLSVVAAICGLCSLLGIAHHHFVGQDEENEEEKQKERKKEEMHETLQGLQRLQRRLDEEMTRANIQRLFDEGFDRKISQVLALGTLLNKRSRQSEPQGNP